MYVQSNTFMSCFWYFKSCAAICMTQTKWPLSVFNFGEETRLMFVGFSLICTICKPMNPFLPFFGPFLLQESQTPLHIAASRGHIECVQGLVGSGACVDPQDSQGSTPLHLALRRHHNQVAMILLHAGANTDVTDESGEAPIHIASREGLLTLAQTLCAFGCSVDQPNRGGLYPLHLAAKNGHTEVVRCVLIAFCNLFTVIHGHKHCLWI